MGCDSLGASGWDMRIRRDRKIYRNGDSIFGFTTSFRMGQILGLRFKPPKRPVEKEVYKYMVTDFVDALRVSMKEAGYAKKENEVESAGRFLVGYEGRLFNIGPDYDVGENESGYDAVGCGESFALGAMYSNSKLNPRERIRQALAAAEAFSCGVRGPFHIESV
jgi:ATP-dependent protease HslVU (ClpYQ) peptidase subunit